MSKQPLLIGKPRNMPEPLIVALKAYLRTVTSVRAAYIAQIFNPAANEPPHLSLALLIDQDLKSIAFDLAKIIQVTIPENEFVDVIDLNDADVKQAFSHLLPFYVAE